MKGYAMNKLGTYFKSIIVPLTVGGIVGWIISGFMDYNSLEKPFLSPPSIMFPIVWTILYVLMGISYGILKDNNLNDKTTSIIYYVQLGVNALWPIAFFVLKWRLFAFVWIIFLVFLVGTMVIQFYEKNKISGLLQIPYLLWSLFASYLNISNYLLNR